MSLYDLNGAKPLEGYSRTSKFAKVQMRALGDPGTVPSGLLSGSGGGGFAAAKINRLTMDFIGRNVSADQDLIGDSMRLRARARELAKNNALFVKFLAEVEQNIVGEYGIQLQSKVTGLNGKQTAQSRQINYRIEQEWQRWCKRGRCTADGRLSFSDLQRLAVRTCAAEGEFLAKLVYGSQFNDSRIALQLLDNDQLDDQYKQTAQEDGSEISLGVEVDGYSRPVAYHCFSGHPSDSGRRLRVRVPADQMVHSFITRRPAQRRGYTWASGSILDMNQLDRYEEAVIVAARASAAKFMVVQQAESEGYTGENDVDGSPEQAAGAPAMTANAGEALVLDPGQTAQFVDPRFPTNNHRDFLRTNIRMIATGLLVSYPTLGNDLESVNFSSIRAGMLDERDCWRILQRWFIQHFVEPVFQAWLRMALLTTLHDIQPYFTPAMADQMVWKGRGWDWVDPLKDTQANVLKLSNNLTTYSAVLASQGLDFEEVMLERAAEQKFITDLGLVLGTDITGVADATVAEEDDGGDQPDKQRVLPGIPGIRVLGTTTNPPRSPEQITAAVQEYRGRLRRLELPAPGEETP